MPTPENRSYTEYLTDIIRQIGKMPLSDAVLEKVGMCLLDHLAAVYSAAKGPVARIGCRVVNAFGDGNCTLIGSNEKASTIGAAFYNALLATSEDIDDAHRYASGLHMGATTFPALFALADSDATITGERFLRAILVGYEISSRIVRAADAAIRERGFHSTGPAGVFGACAASASLLGLSSQNTVNALGIAASASGGLFAFLKEGCSVRHAHAAWACANGIQAVLLARAGMTGPRFILEGYENNRDGWLNAYAGKWDESLLLAPLGRLEIQNAYHKMHATCGHATPAITALQILRNRVLPHKDEIASIVIKGYKASAALNNPWPQSISEAKFSLPFIAGVILLYGQATLREMVPAALENAEIHRIASLVRVVEDPDIAASFPRLRAGEVIITFTDGKVLSQRVDAPLGMPENPVSLDVIEAKFRNAAEDLLPRDRQDKIIAMVHNLESLASTKNFVAQLASIPGLKAKLA